MSFCVRFETLGTGAPCGVDVQAVRVAAVGGFFGLAYLTVWSLAGLVPARHR